MILLLFIGLTIILLIWVLRAIVISSKGITLSILAIIFNIANLIALVGYALILYDNIHPRANISPYEEMEEINKPKSKSIIYINSYFNRSDSNYKYFYYI